MGISTFPAPVSEDLPIGATSTVFAGIASDGDYQHVGTIPTGNYISYVVSSTTPYVYSPANLGAVSTQTLTSGVSSFVSINASESNFGMSSNFSSSNNNSGTFNQASVIWDGTIYMGKVGVANTVVVSNNGGLSWTTRSVVFSGPENPQGGQIQTLAYNAGVTNKYITVTTLGSSGGGYISTSTDGITWTARSGNIYATSGVGGVLINAATTNKYIMVVSGPGQPIQTSTDGVTWTRTASYTPPNSFSGYGATNGTASTNQIYVYSQTSGTSVSTSTDGLTWANRTTGLTTGAGVAFGAGIYLLIENGSTSNYATSTDGVTWTTRVFPNNFIPSLNVTFTNGVFVTGFSQTYATSTDGVTWRWRQATTGASSTNGWAGDGNKLLAYRTAVAYYQVPAYFALYSTTGTPAL